LEDGAPELPPPPPPPVPALEADDVPPLDWDSKLCPWNSPPWGCAAPGAVRAVRGVAGVRVGLATTRAWRSLADAA